MRLDLPQRTLVESGLQLIASPLGYSLVVVLLSLMSSEPVVEC